MLYTRVGIATADILGIDFLQDVDDWSTIVSRLNDVFTDSREADFFFVAQVDRNLLAFEAFREQLVAFASLGFRFRLTASFIIFIASLLDAFTSIVDLFRCGELELELLDIVKAFALATKDATDQRFKFVLALAKLLAEFFLKKEQVFLSALVESKTCSWVKLSRLLRQAVSSLKPP